MFQFVGRFIQRKAAVARLEEAVRPVLRGGGVVVTHELDLRVESPTVKEVS